MAALAKSVGYFYGMASQFPWNWTTSTEIQVSTYYPILGYCALIATRKRQQLKAKIKDGVGVRWGLGIKTCQVSSVVERLLCNEDVRGPIPLLGSTPA